MCAEQQKEREYDLTMTVGIFTPLTLWHPPHGNASGFVDEHGDVYRPILCWEKTEHYGDAEDESHHDLTTDEAAAVDLFWDYDSVEIEPTRRER